MNELNLRVSGGIGEKVKKPAAPLSMPYWNNEMRGTFSEFYSSFTNSNSADNQLKLLRQFLNGLKDVCEQDTVKFLVLLFWHADGKHPVKGFLKKHITDSKTLNQPFTETLTTVIATEIEDSSQSYGDYIDTITRLDTGTDKFPPGAAAVGSLEVDVTSYYVHCLESCINTLGLVEQNISSEVKSEPLAPTEINKIYDLVHLTLRLLLYMIQKVSDENRDKLSSMFSHIRSIISELMLGKEVPMDTKSVSGIVYLTIHLFENGSESWITVMEEDRSNENGTVNLCIYSAIATVVPPGDLITVQVNGLPAIIDLTDKILAIGDRYSSESSHTLAVARTLAAASRALAAGRGRALALAPLAARLARWCWPHLEHHVDSVRHLAQQLMARVAAAAAQLQREGDSSVLEHLFSSLATLDSSRKSFYVTLTALAETMGSELLMRRPDVIHDAIHSLRTQAVQACATTFLETLLKRHMKESDTETIYRQWILVILETAKRESDPAVLGVLERILTKAVQWDSGVLRYILPEQRALSSYEGSDLKCILLVLGVVRKSGVTYKGVTLDDLRHAAYDADDETRVLSLSLAGDTPRSCQRLSRAELAFVPRFLQYNANAQAPSFRQLILANMKKILKRVEDSYKVLKRRESDHAAEIASYLQFVSGVRAACFDSLAVGAAANYGRRVVSLQLLSWLEVLQLAGWDRTWTEVEAEILYNLLEDSYENNKALALEVLKNCPVDLIKLVHSPEYVTDAIAQASSVKPTECVTASYKLLLLLSLPLDVELYHENHDVPSSACYSLVTRVLTALRQHVSRARDIVRAARDAPMYGLVHCLARLVACLDATTIAGNERWSALIADMIATCYTVNERVSGIVAAASPEGLLPHSQDTGGELGRPVTAQMVLLCAWRSVKETSLLLGSIVSRLSLEGEAPAWTLSASQVEQIGEHLIMLLSTVKHRGAFEQAYVGLTLLLGRLWKCKSGLHQLPLQWFSSIERSFALPADGASTEFCATRRGAGLPFMIQALVTTELAAESTAPLGRLLHRCLDLCLRVACAPAAAADAARAHLVLRALYRHTTPSDTHTARTIVAAVRGFDADTWTERNSSTLLFSTLMVRVFGVARSAGHKLSPRNTMTGRIFFLRHPQLYDFLLEQLKSVPGSGSLRPSLFPTLLLLARLYPSALEGTVSNLKLECFLPHLLSLSGARDAGSRRLAARAAAPLVPPHSCVAHMLSILRSLGNPAVNKNLCHGLLCQLTVLLELKPSLTIDEHSRPEMRAAIRGTFWISIQTCFLVGDQWLQFINLVLIRFPKLLDDDLRTISALLEMVLFGPVPRITSGREVFLSNSACMLFIIGTTPALILACLQHKDYEVNLAALNYLLVLHGYKEDNCMFLEHLSKVSNNEMLKLLEQDETYVKFLCNVTKNGYLECKQKALKVLALTENTQREIVKLKLGNNEVLTDDIVIKELVDSIRNGHANLSSIYLESLLSFVSKPVLELVRVLYECSGAGNDEGTRDIVVRYLERHLGMLMEASAGNDAETFEWSATLAATAAILLEDDAPAVRQRAANAVLDAISDKGKPGRAISWFAARSWRRWAAGARRGAALLVTLAALDFCADVETADELGEECRVFDQNETHNVYLEEFTWSKECAVEMKRIYRQTANTQTVQEYLQSILYNPTYKVTIEKLCIDNAVECLTGQMETSNPKINLFLKILYE